MSKLNQVITALAVTFFVNGAVVAQEHEHQRQGHGHAEDHTEVPFVHAEVVEIDTEHNELVLRHEAIPNLDMAAMTMAFSVADAIDVTQLSEGDEIMVKVERQDQSFVVIEMDGDQHNH